MVLARIRQLVDRLSVRAIFNRLDKRKLQYELDTHRLYLVTSHFDRLRTGEDFGEQYVQKLAAEAQQLGHEGTKTAVAAALHKQVVSISTVLHSSLADASDPMPAALHAISAVSRRRQHAALAAAPKTQRPRGLAAAMGVADPRSNRAAAAHLSETAPRPPGPQSETDPIPTPSSAPLPSPNPSRSRSSSVSDKHSSSSSSDSNSDSDSGSEEDTHPNSPRTTAPGLHPDSGGSNYAGPSETPISSSNQTPPWGYRTDTEKPSSASLGNTAPAAALSMAQLSSALQQQIGYSLAVQPSGIAHPNAGDGLFLQGSAPVGAVVALYPGLVYEPMHFRKIPGYPKIDANNDYFLARFDGALIDGQSWGRGRSLIAKQPDLGMDFHSSRHANLAELHQRELYRRSFAAVLPGMDFSMYSLLHYCPLPGNPTCTSLTTPLQSSAQMRHPLALAHFANHPAAGTQPNVMVAAFDLALKSGEEPWLSAYMPNIMYCDSNAAAADGGNEQLGVIKGLAFVALRQIQDEEVFLNYRLNPQVQKPAWYAPVDVEEDKRRWY